MTVHNRIILLSKSLVLAAPGVARQSESWRPQGESNPYYKNENLVS